MQKSVSLEYEPASDPLHIFCGVQGARPCPTFFFLFISLKRVTAHFCGEAVLKLRTVPICPTATERMGNNLQGFRGFHLQNGERQGQTPALTGFIVPNSLDSVELFVDATCFPRGGRVSSTEGHRRCVQGYLTHKISPPPLGPPQGPRHRPTVGS